MLLSSMVRCFETVCEIIIASKGLIYRSEKGEIEAKCLDELKIPQLKEICKTAVHVNASTDSQFRKK